MRTHLGQWSASEKRLALVAAALWSTVIKMSSIRFWLRLGNVSHDRLNCNIFTETCRLAENGKKNRASSIKVYLNYLNSYLGFRTSITDTFYSTTEI